MKITLNLPGIILIRFFIDVLWCDSVIRLESDSMQLGDNICMDKGEEVWLY